MTTSSGELKRMASRRTELLIARALLSAAHSHVTETLSRIHAIETEIRETVPSTAALRIQTVQQTKQWFASHPEEARAISEFFFPLSR